jgi:hypothetical protein
MLAFLQSIVLSLILMQGSIDLHLYTFHIGENVTVAWDDTQQIDHYESQLWHYEQDLEVHPVALANIPGTNRQVTFAMPRTGHYEVWIRGCSTTECSEWAKSNLHGHVNNNPRGWWIYGFPAPVTDGGLE